MTPQATTPDELNPFTQGYAQAATASVGASLDDLAPETRARIIADCEVFSAAPCATGGSYAGKMFWLARQAPRHAKGAREGNRYWDAIADFPPQTPYVADDGKVRFQ